MRPGLRRRRQPAGPGQPADKPGQPAETSLPATGDQPPDTAELGEPADTGQLNEPAATGQPAAAAEQDAAPDFSPAGPSDWSDTASLNAVGDATAVHSADDVAAEAAAADAVVVLGTETAGPQSSGTAADSGTAETGTETPGTETPGAGEGGGEVARARPRRSWLGASRLGRQALAAAERMPFPRMPRVPLTGMEFSRLTLVPVLLVIAWLLPAIPLLLAGSFALAPMLVISIPLALVLIAVALRRVPGRWPMSAQPGHGRGATAPLWSLIATVAVAGGFIAWQIVMKSQAVIVTRDPGVYLQYGYWIAQHGTVPIPTSAAAFGGLHPGLGFASTGFTLHGAHLTPDFMAGLPSVLAAGYWAGGISAAMLVPPVLGGLAVLTFAGLTGRLAGPRWAPAGALVLALALPEQYTGRTAFAEPLSQILLFGGLCLIIDALSLPPEPPAVVPVFPRRGLAATIRRVGSAARPTTTATLAALGGLAIGLTAVARIDGLSDALPALLFIGVLLAARRRPWVALSIGLAVGVGYGLAAGYVLARPYLDSLSTWTGPFAIIAAGTAVVMLDLALVWRYAGLGRFAKRVFAARPLRWLPWVAAALTVLVAVGFAVRPYVQTVRGDTNVGEVSYVGYLQRVAGLPLDVHRLYSEDTLYWVIWYIGLPALLLGIFGLALLTRRVTRALLTWEDPDGAARIWALPLLIIGWVTVTVLWRPGTTPDQPWAARRLVPVVLPGLILAAVWAAAWLNGRARLRGAGKVLSSAVAVLCVAALLLPTILTTFGIGTSTIGERTPKPAGGLALQRTGLGQAAAVDRLCDSIGPGASVIIVDPRVASQFTQLIRGMCNVPVAVMDRPSGFAVQPVVSGITAAHRRPVLLGGSSAQVSRYGGAPREILNLVTTQDAHVLTHPPSGTWPAHYMIWMSQPSSIGA